MGEIPFNPRSAYSRVVRFSFAIGPPISIRIITNRNILKDVLPLLSSEWDIFFFSLSQITFVGYSYETLVERFKTFSAFYIIKSLYSVWSPMKELMHSNQESKFNEKEKETILILEGVLSLRRNE